jgi:hypothetical protein
MRLECGTPEDCKITGEQGCKEMASPGGYGRDWANDAHIKLPSIGEMAVEKNRLERSAECT